MVSAEALPGSPGNQKTQVLLESPKSLADTSMGAEDCTQPADTAYASEIAQDDPANGPPDDEQQREQITVAMLAMLANACKQVPSNEAGDAGDEEQHGGTAGQYQMFEDTDEAEEVRHLGFPAKRTSNTAGFSSKRQHKQQRRSASGPSTGVSPSTSDSPVSMGAAAAVAAAAGLHKLSSAAQTEFEAVLTGNRLGSAGDYATGPLLPSQRRVVQGTSGGSSGAVAGGTSGRETAQQIMEQLVECGLLPSCGPDTHCYVKCGNVQGVFSLASGSILCLCNECSESSTGPVWFAPAAFERHGGMAASKKWRGSIQVKGLSSRKTLGQWLDERGVTAKPRLTLADQVLQQHTPSSSTRARTGHLHASAQQRGDLAVAAANVARLSKATVGGPSAGAATSALRRGSSGVDNLDALHTGTADHSRAAAEHVQLGRAALTHTPGFPSSMERLLAEVAAATASTRASDHEVEQQDDGGYAGHALEVQEQDALNGFLQQLQQLQQQSATALPSPASAAAAAASSNVNPLAMLVDLLPDLFGGDKAAAAASLKAVTAAPPAAAAPAAAAAAQEVKPEHQTERAVARLAEAVATSPKPLQQPKRSLNELLTQATATAATDPGAASLLLMEALQRQLQAQPQKIKQAAAGASAAVAKASELAGISKNQSKHTSAAAAFAAIAAAAAAAAAATAALEANQSEGKDSITAHTPQQAAPAADATAAIEEIPPEQAGATAASELPASLQLAAQLGALLQQRQLSRTEATPQPHLSVAESTSAQGITAETLFAALLDNIKGKGARG